MRPVRKLERFTLPLTVDSIRVEVSGLYRNGTGTPLVFFHGFGSTKEDFADVIQHERLAAHPVLAYDAPGAGTSTCTDLRAVSIPFLVAVAEQVLKARQVERFHLISHSMGGLIALILADHDPGRVASFTNIEGNLAPEDCFLSRQIITHPDDDPDEFLTRFADRVGRSRFCGGAPYAAALPYKVKVGAVKAIFESMVDLSDHGKLLDRFLRLPTPKMFMYGEQNSTLSYLPALAEGGVELAEIEHCAHFPMYSNPPQMWAHIADLVSRAEAAENPRERSENGTAACRGQGTDSESRQA